MLTFFTLSWRSLREIKVSIFYYNISAPIDEKKIRYAGRMADTLGIHSEHRKEEVCSP